MRGADDLLSSTRRLHCICGVARARRRAPLDGGSFTHNNRAWASTPAARTTLTHDRPEITSATR